MAYPVSPTDVTRPLNSDPSTQGAEELRALKAYLQTLIVPGGTIPVNGYAWQGFRNKIINGNFDEWRRGVAALAAGVGTRWLADRHGTSSQGSTVAPTQQVFAVGQTLVPNEPTYYQQNVIASVAGVSNYALQFYRIESVRTLAGQTATFSVYLRADAVKSVAIEVFQRFGTGGGASADVTVLVQKVAITTAFALYTFTMTLPSITGKTIGTNLDDCIGINIWFDAGSNFNARTGSLGQQSGTYAVGQMQFEPGVVATPFEIIPPAIRLEQCQRYLPAYSSPTIGNQLVCGGFMIATNSFLAILPYKTKTRIPATSVVFTSVLIFSVAAGSLGTTSNGITYNVATSTDAAMLLINTVGGMTIGDGGLISFVGAGGWFYLEGCELIA